MQKFLPTQNAAVFLLLLALACKSALGADGAGNAAASAEQRLEALRHALIDRAMQAPSRIKSSAWIDESGRLQESTRITSEMQVRGIRLMANADAQDVNNEKIMIDAVNALITPGPCTGASAPWRRRATLKIEKPAAHHGAIGADQMAEIIRTTEYFLSETWGGRGAWSLLPASDLNQYEQLVSVGRAVTAPYGITLSVVAAKAGVKPKVIAQTVSALFAPATPVLPDSLLTLSINVTESASAQAVWSTAETIPVPGGEVSLQKRLLPDTVSAQIAGVISRWKQQLETVLKCEPVFFNVVRDSDGTLNINAGRGSGIRENDKVLVIDQEQIPRHILEGALDQGVFLAEVESVTSYSSRLRFFPKPPARSTSRWIAIPF